MIIDNDTTGIEQADKDMRSMKSFRPYAEWFAVKLDGEWGVYDRAGKVTRAAAKAQSICPQILEAQKHNPAVIRRLRQIVEGK